MADISFSNMIVKGKKNMGREYDRECSICKPILMSDPLCQGKMEGRVRDVQALIILLKFDAEFVTLLCAKQQ